MAPRIGALRSSHAESTESSTLGSLYRDERGAMMVTGLFMSMFLIGTLWFLIGIGNAIVFRDRMQEAVDSGAFAASALHAKGMNFIALMNLLMIVGTIIHLVLGIISDIKFAQAAKITYECLQTGPLIPFCLPAVVAAVGDFMTAYDRWTKYFKQMERAFEKIHTAQVMAANVYPAAGVAEAYAMGKYYGEDNRTGPVRVVAVSTSVFPGALVAPIAGKLPKAGNIADTMKKEALPVRAKKFAELCNYTVKFGSNTALQLFGAGSQEGGSLGGRATQMFNAIVGTSLQVRYCNGGDVPSLDDLPFSTALDKMSEVIAGSLSGVPPFGHGFDKFWDKDGPFVVWGPAENGNDWFQTWAFNVSPMLRDTSESHVGIAAKKLEKYTREETPATYVAQSEFYFNCKDKWSTPNCNFEDHAMFAINWRARLRRVKSPNVLGMLLGTGFQMISDMKSIPAVKASIGNKLDELIGGGALTKGAVDSAISQLEDWLKGLGTSGISGPEPTLYH